MLLGCRHQPWACNSAFFYSPPCKTLHFWKYLEFRPQQHSPPSPISVTAQWGGCPGGP